MRYAALSIVLLATTFVCSSPCHAQIAWEGKLRDAHDKAQQQNKLMLLHFYTDNCIFCDRLEAGAFQDPTVSSAINKNFVPVKVHGGKNPKLAKLFQVTKYPTDVIVTTEGKALSHAVSPQQPARYVAMLASTYAGFNQSGTMIAANAATQAPAQPAAAQVAAVPPAATKPAVATNPPAAQTVAAKQAPTSASPAATAPATEALVTKEPAIATNQPAAENSLSLPTGDLPVQVPASKKSAMDIPAIAANAPAKPAATTQNNQFMLPSGDLPLPTENKLAHSDVTATTNAVAKSGTHASMAAARLDTKPTTIETEKPELAIQGYCPVSVVKDGQWLEGKPEFGVIHLGKLYLFANKPAMQAFMVDPMPYTPMLNEIDVVRFFEEKKIVKGNREWGVIDPIHNRMFFFADEAAMLHFEASFERYVDAAIEVMDQAIKESNPGV
ncbi:DUF255 domain-containing protein [Stieleria sp. JC731]|uniref:thioredoxin family protein n=1 Tax=Pirellulaceae TaxID=2691357 RepID=UPI001E582D0A|nr:thioredoxin family protein [Stieleria sp. JC731]MCC9604090.1 DUF255 domain-containing protein [Stieleria sp. JC731]